VSRSASKSSASAAWTNDGSAVEQGGTVAVHGSSGSVGSRPASGRGHVIENKLPPTSDNDSRPQPNRLPEIKIRLASANSKADSEAFSAAVAGAYEFDETTDAGVKPNEEAHVENMENASLVEVKRGRMGGERSKQM